MEADVHWEARTRTHSTVHCRRQEHLLLGLDAIQHVPEGQNLEALADHAPQEGVEQGWVLHGAFHRFWCEEVEVAHGGHEPLLDLLRGLKKISQSKHTPMMPQGSAMWPNWLLCGLSGWASFGKNLPCLPATPSCGGSLNFVASK